MYSDAGRQASRIRAPACQLLLVSFIGAAAGIGRSGVKGPLAMTKSREYNCWSGSQDRTPSTFSPAAPQELSAPLSTPKQAHGPKHLSSVGQNFVHLPRLPGPKVISLSVGAAWGSSLNRILAQYFQQICANWLQTRAGPQTTA